MYRGQDYPAAIDGQRAGARWIIAADNDPTLDSQWDALAYRAIEANSYAERWFMRPALAQFDHASRVRLFTLWDDQNTLQGLIPLVCTRGYGRFPIVHTTNWMHTNMFLGTPLVASGFEHIFWQALLDALDHSPWARNLLNLSMQHEDGPVYRALVDVSAAQGRRCDVVMREQRAMVHTALTADAYWHEAVRAKKRKELRRQMARLEEQGIITLDRLSADADLARWSNEFLALEREGWKGKHGSALDCQADTRAFFSEMMSQAKAADKIDMVALRLDAKPIAMLIHLVAHGGCFSFKTAYDERFARFSPGVLLQQFALGLIDTCANTWIDSCATENHPMIDSLWKERRSIVRVAVAIGDRRDRALFGSVRNLERLRAWSKRYQPWYAD